MREVSFQTLIQHLITQMARSGLLGVTGSLTTGMAYGVPPILQHGSPDLQERFPPGFLTGQKRSCIAVTEPDAGSDVVSVTTTAEKSEDGNFSSLTATRNGAYYVIGL
jgi:acyl-CoA dehydrogenase